MQAKVSGETPFKVLKDTCAIAPTTNGYTLNYAVSKDGPWTAWPEEVPADETLIINGLTPFMWLSLEGNEDEVEVIL